MTTPTDTRTETEKRLYEMAQAYLSGVRTSDAFALDIITTVRDRYAPPKPLMVEGWVNVYPGQPDDEALCAYRSRRAADLGANATRLACIYVSGEEGKGPDQ